MRYLRLLVLTMIVISSLNLAAELQDLDSAGKKNLRSANMHLGGERFEKALPLYLSVIEANPYHIEALEKTAGIYFDFKRDYYKASEFYNKADEAIDMEIADYEKLIAENPKKEKKYTKKITPLQEKKTFLATLNSSCWTQIFLRAQSKFTVANDFYSLNPQELDMTDINNVKVVNQLLNRIYADTINVSTVAENPADMEVVTGHFTKLLDESISEFTQLHEFAPDSIKTLKMLSFAQNVKGNKEETLQSLIKVAELDKEDEMVRQQIANTYFGDGNYEEALIWFQSAADSNPENSDSYFNMGIVYEQLDNKEEAFNSFVKVVELDPTNLDAVLHASNLAAKIDKKEESINYLKMAVDLDPGNIDYLQFLSYSMFQEKNYEETIIYAQKWYEVETTSKEAAQLVYQSAKLSGNNELESKFEKILTDMQ